MRHLKTPAVKVGSLQFAPDGRSLYLLSVEIYITPNSIGERPSHAYRVAVDSGEMTGNWPFKQSDIATFSPDLYSLYFWPALEPYSWDVESRYLHRLDLGSGSVQQVFSVDADAPNPFGCGMSPDGRVLAFGMRLRERPSMIHRLDLQTMTEREAIRTDGELFTYSLDGRWLAAGRAWDNRVQVWEEAACVDEWYEPSTALAWSPDGRLAWGTGEQFTVLRPGTKEAARTWRAGGDTLSALAFSPDGRLLLAGDKNGTCTFHDSHAGGRRNSFAWGIGPIHSVAFSPDGLTCAAGGENGQIVVWDVDS